MKFSFFRLAGAVVLIGALSSGPVRAANRIWSGNATDNTWGNGTNWAGTVPVANDALFFAGSTQLANSNSLAANMAFAGITFNSGAGAFLLSGNAITLNGTVTNSSTSTQTINLNMIMLATRTFAALTGNLSVGGILSGAGGLTKTGTSTLTLSGANTYNGTTTVSAGTLKLGNATALGSTTGGTTITAGTLDLNGQTIGAEAIVLSSTALLVNNSGTAASLSGAISGLGAGTIMGGSGNLTLSGVVTSTGNGAWLKTGNGTLTLTGTNTFTRALTISAGAVNIQNSLALGVTNNNLVTVSANAALEMQGNITSSGKRLTLTGNGTSNTGALRNISGNNTYGAAIVLGSATRINSDSGTLTLNGTTTITGATFGLTVGGAGNTTISRVIGTTTGTLTKDGAGTLTLSAANTYTGLTTVSAGTLAYGIANAISTGLVTVNGGTLDMKTFSDTVGAVTLTTGSIAGTTGVLTGTSYNLNGNGSASAILAGTGAVVKSGAGTTTTLSGNNTFTGITTISSGTLSVGTIGNGTAASNLGNATNTAANLVLNGGTLQYTGATLSTNRTFTVGSNQGTIDASGTGTLTLTAAPTFSANATLTLAGSNAGNNTLSGVITNNGTTSLKKSGTGTWVLTANNTYTGNTTVSGGILEFAGTSTTGALNITAGNLKLDSASRLIGAAPALSISSGASLTMAGSESIGSIAGAGTANLTSGTLTVGTTSGSSIFDGLIAGAGVLTKGGASKLSLSGNNTYTGGTSITSGELSVDKSQGLGTGTLSLTGNATSLAVLDYTAGNSTLSVGALTLNGNSTISLQPNSQILSSGAVTINGTNNLLSISGSTWAVGTSTLLSGTFLTGSAISLTGQAINNQTLALGSNTTIGRVNYAFGSTATSLTLLTTGYIYDLVWNGTFNSTWSTNATYTNWQQATVPGIDIAFYTNDNIFFTNNATSGPITVDAAGVHAGEMDFSNTSGTVTLQGGDISGDDLTKTGAGALIINGNLTLADTNGDLYEYFTNSGSGDVTIGGIFSGVAGLVQSGTGTLTLSATNTYSAGTTVSDGTLALGANNALGNGTLTITGGTVNVGSFNQSSLGAVSLTSGNITGTGTLSGTSYAVASGNISAILGGAAALIKSTADTVTLSGANTYTGATTINDGTLKYGADNALSSTAAVTINANTGGTAILDLNGFNGTIGSLTFGGVDGLAGSLNQVTTGSGTLTLGGDVTSVDTGNPTGSDTISGKLNLGSATRTFTVGDSGGNFAEMDVQAAISGPAVGINKAGSGVLVLSGSNTYAGATTVNAGLLRLANNSALGTSAGGTTVNDGASIGLAGVTITDEAMTFIGTGIIDPFGAAAGALRNYSGNNTITGTAHIGIGSGSVFTTRINAYINPTTLTLSGTGVVQGAASGAQTLELYGQTASTGVLSRVIQNGSATSLAVTKAEAGLWILSGNNTYTGGTTVSDGTLQIGAGGTTGNLSATGGIVNNGTFIINRSNAVAQGTDFSAISGSGSFIQAGSGNTTLTAANTYTGATNIDAGTLLLSGSTAADSTVNVGTAGTLAGNGTVNGNATLTGGGIINLSGTGTIIGTLGVTGGYWNGKASVVGAVTASSGTFTAGSDANLTAEGGLFVSGNSMIEGTGTITGNVSYTSSRSSTFAGVIAGSSSVTKAGAGTLTLSGNNTYTGGTLFSAGTLGVNNAASLGNVSGSLTFGGSGTLQLDASFDSSRSYVIDTGVTATIDTNSYTQTNTGTISGDGGLTKLGSGSLALSANNTFTGPTDVAGGTLLVNGSTGAGAVTVAPGATLGGNGTLTGTTTVSGVISPGNGGIGMLTTGNLTWNGAESASADTNWIFQLGAGNSSDLLSINGIFAQGPGSVFQFDFGPSLETGTFTLVTFGSSSGFTSTSFSNSSLGINHLGSFNLTDTSLEFTVTAVPEPATWVAALSLCAGLLIPGRRFWKRKSQHIGHGGRAE